MKKIFAVLLVFILLLLSGCGNSNSDHTEYLKKDNEKGEEYNQAIEAYNKFLSGSLSAKNNKSGSEDAESQYLFVNQMKNKDLESGIDKYGLYDMNNDNIPELIIESNDYDVFFYENEGLTLVWGVDDPFSEGTAYLLENGAIFSKNDTNGIKYHYITINSNLSVSDISFYDGGSNEESGIYYFDSESVPKSQFEKLTKRYLEAAEKPADIKWYNYAKKSV